MIYDYVCINCGEHFPTQIDLGDYVKGNYEIFCPKCSSQEVRRSFRTTANIIFKGRGFTKTAKEEE